MKKSKVLAVLLILALSLALCACGSSAAPAAPAAPAQPAAPAEPAAPSAPSEPAPAPEVKADPVTIDLVATFPAGNINYTAALLLADEVAEKTAGEISFNFLGGTEIFSGAAAAEAVLSGALDAAFIGSDYFTGFVPAVAAVNASNMTYEDMLASGALDYLNETFTANGARMVYVVDEVGIQGTVIYTNKPVSSLEELKGMTIRTSGTAQDAIMKALGCTPTPLGLGEIFTGLEQGLIEGYCGPSFLGGAMGFFEYSKCQISTEIARGGTALLVNEDVWQSMSADQQDLLVSVLREINADEVALYSQAVADNRALLADAGGAVVDLSAEDDAALKELASQYAWEAVENTVPADVYEQLHTLFTK